MKKGLFILICLLIPSVEGRPSIDDEFPDDVMLTLEKADGNRKSLVEMLRHYKRGKDRERYEAACFLVSNMRWHSLGGRVVSYDPRMDSLRNRADSTYYRLIKGTTAEAQESDPLHKTLGDSVAAAAARVQVISFSEPEVEVFEKPDIRIIDGRFIASQIESAFRLRREKERIRNLSFADFCEYVLPYRSIGNYPLVVESKTLSDFFGKYLLPDESDGPEEIGARYNRVLWWLRHWHGRYPFDTTIGFPDLFYTGFHDCIDMACDGMKRHPEFLYSYAAQLNQAGEYRKSDRQLASLRLLLNDYDTELLAADNALRTGRNNRARLHLKRAHEMIPARIMPLYGMLLSYNQEHDSLNARRAAVGILRQPVKIPSRTIRKIRQEAQAQITE